MNLEQGKVYLTIGTAQQIQYLFRDHAARYKVLEKPTTEEFISCVETTPPDLEWSDYDCEVLLVYPKELVGTGKLKGRGSPSKSQSKYALPNDQFFSVSRGLYVFIICTDVNGEYNKTSSELKKLKSHQFVELDLRKLDYGVESNLLKAHQMFPISLLDKIERPELGSSIAASSDAMTIERRLVRGLTTLEGVKRWGQFSDKELYKYFLIENYKTIPLLSMTKSWCLTPYILPFVEAMRINRRVNLEAFAFWVYQSSNMWAESRSKGLVSYIPKGADKTERFSFWPSKKARHEWISLLDVLN